MLYLRWYPDVHKDQLEVKYYWMVFPCRWDCFRYECFLSLGFIFLNNFNIWAFHINEFGSTNIFRKAVVMLLRNATCFRGWQWDRHIIMQRPWPLVQRWRMVLSYDYSKKISSFIFGLNHHDDYLGILIRQNSSREAGFGWFSIITRFWSSSWNFISKWI